MAGCQTKKAAPPKPPEPPHGYLNTMPGNAVAPAVPVSRLESAAGEVLGGHRFLPAKSIVHPDGTTWIVSPRPDSANEISLVTVKASPKSEVQVEITGYSRVGNSWALLGALFDAPMKREAAEIEKQIQDKLGRPSL